MSHEIKNMPVELSVNELDNVAGGVSIGGGDDLQALLASTADFNQKTLVAQQDTVAGPNGSGTSTKFAAQEIDTDAAQLFAIDI